MKRLVLALVLTAAVAGCASEPIAGSPPASHGPGTGSTSLPPADQVVFQVSGGVGGLAPPAIWLSHIPDVTIYGDGRAFTQLESRSYTGAPPGVAQGAVPPDRLRALVAAARASGVFASHVDFGTPQVTDLGATSMTFRPGRAPMARASAYALEYREGDDRLSGAQQHARRALRTLIADVSASVRPSTHGEWRPARVDVTQLTYGASTGAARPEWPGPAPARLLTHRRATSRCGELTGTQAAIVYAAARHNRSIGWTVDGRPVQLIVRPLLPGLPACR